MHKASPKWADDLLSVYITYICTGTYCQCYTFVFRDLKHVIIKLLNNLHTSSSLTSSIHNLASDIICTFIFNFALILSYSRSRRVSYIGPLSRKCSSVISSCIRPYNNNLDGFDGLSVFHRDHLSKSCYISWLLTRDVHGSQKYFKIFSLISYNYLTDLNVYPM